MSLCDTCMHHQRRDCMETILIDPESMRTNSELITDCPNYLPFPKKKGWFS